MTPVFYILAHLVCGIAASLVVAKGIQSRGASLGDVFVCLLTGPAALVGTVVVLISMHCGQIVIKGRKL